MQTERSGVRANGLRTTTRGALLIFGMVAIAVTARGKTFNWTGATSDAWNLSSNWDCPVGCELPPCTCFGYPDGTNDDAIVNVADTIDMVEVTIDDLDVGDHVTLGKVSTGYCQSFTLIKFDSVSITAGTGNTASLSVGTCINLVTE